MGTRTTAKILPINGAGREHDLAGPTTQRQTLERFAAWWARQGPDMQASIREIVRDAARKPHTAEADQVLAHLNAQRERLGLSPFRYVEEHRRLLRARISSGISVADLRAINAVKARQVKAGEFNGKHLRPRTLYSASLCEQYLAELPPRLEAGGTDELFPT